MISNSIQIQNERNKKMKLNFALYSQWVATGYVSIVSFLIVFILGKILGPEKFGIYSYILTISSLYLILQEGGFRTLLFREGTSLSTHLKVKNEQIIKRANGHVVIFTIFGILLTLILPINYKLEIATAIFCFSFSCITGYASAYMKGEGLFEQEAKWQIIVRTFTALSIIIALIAGIKNISALFLFWSIGFIFALLLPIGHTIRYKPEFKFNIELLRSNTAILSINAATALYFRCDIILLKYLKREPHEIGEYAAAYRLLEGVILLITPIAHIGFRYLRISMKDKDAFNRLFLMLITVMVVFSVFIYGIGQGIGHYIVSLTFGNRYILADDLLLILLNALFFILPNSIITQGMIALNKEIAYAFAALFAVLLNVVGNIWAIPIYGAKGAATVTVATEAALLIILSIFYFRFYFKWNANGSD